MKFILITLQLLMTVNILSGDEIGKYVFPDDKLFPQSYYFNNLYGFEISFNNGYIDYNCVSIDKNLIRSEVFHKNFYGQYSIEKSDPFYILKVELESGEELRFVLHWTLDSIILTDLNSKESILGTGNEYFIPPKSSLPHIEPFSHISVSSYFEEVLGDKLIKYTGNNLYNWDLTMPWVEGVDGPGIGEYILLREFDKTRSITIANGYFDPTRPDLYYANNRLKTVRIYCSNEPDMKWDYSTIWQLEDTYNLQSFVLSDKWEYLKIEIIEVYPGTVYDDTCIAGLYLHHGLNYPDNISNYSIVLPQPIR